MQCDWAKLNPAQSTQSNVEGSAYGSNESLLLKRTYSVSGHSKCWISVHKKPWISPHDWLWTLFNFCTVCTVAHNILHNTCIYLYIHLCILGMYLCEHDLKRKHLPNHWYELTKKTLKHILVTKIIALKVFCMYCFFVFYKNIWRFSLFTIVCNFFCCLKKQLSPPSTMINVYFLHNTICSVHSTGASPYSLSALVITMVIKQNTYSKSVSLTYYWVMSAILWRAYAVIFYI